MVSSALKKPQEQIRENKSRSLFVQASTLYASAKGSDQNEHLKQALAKAERAHLADPGSLQCCNLLARIQLRLGDFKNAEHWVSMGLGLKPDSTSLLYTAGLIALEQHQLDKAEEYFAHATRISRVATRAPVSLAHIHLLKGNFREALAEYRELLRSNPEDVYLQSRLMEAAAGVNLPHYDEEIAAELPEWFSYSGDISLLDRLSFKQIKLRYEQIQAQKPLELQDLLTDPLLHKSLASFAVVDPDIEQLLTSARLAILHQATRQLSISSEFWPLTIAIARQTSINEGCWIETSDENEQISRLQLVVSKLLQLGDEQSLQAAGACLGLILMYRPLSTTELHQTLSQMDPQQPAWPQDLADFLQQQLQEMKDRQLHAEVIPQLGHDMQGQPRQPAAFSDTAITRLYESNPYPRWQYLGNYPKGDYIEMLQKQFPNRLNQLTSRQPLNVLVAGCGTGRQALRLARFFDHLQITAMDVSLASLSYGRARQADFGLSVDWIQGDILDVAQLNQSFDAIECSGVLHHLNNPLTGLMALSSSLKAGGVIKLALYSRTARLGIQQLRKQLDTPELQTADEIRQLRFSLREMNLQQQQGFSARQRQEILASRDFYTLSGCRDLLCNPVEHLFDISQIEDWLQRAGLKWVGMLASGRAVQLADEYFQQPAAELTPQQWQQIEKEHTQLFAGMYQFYAIKPAFSDLHG